MRALAAVTALAALSCGDGPTPALEIGDTRPASATGAPAGSSPSATAGPAATPVSAATPASAATGASAAPSGSASPSLAAERGLWIWELGVNGPPAERAAELAASWGVRRVFLKSGNGAARGRWARNFGPENRAAFARRGIEVWAFAYVYGEGVADLDGRTWGTVDEQIDAVADATVHDGVAGLVVDAEIELVGRADDARRFCEGLRARLGPTRKLAYTTFGWIQKWRSFPFEDFDRGCGDAFLPQVYFAEGWPGGVEASLERLAAGIAARGLRAPVWPVQTNMPNPDVTVMRSFFAAAGPRSSVFFLHPEGTEQTRRLALLDWRAP